MIQVLNHFSKLVLFRNRPQDLPYSVGLFGSLFVLSLLTFYLLSQDNPYQAFAFSLVTLDKTLFLLVLYFALKTYGLVKRFTQTATNLVGVGFISMLILYPFAQTVKSPLLLCLILAWFIMLKVHILQHAFNTTRLRAVLIFLSISLISFLTLLVVMQLASPLLPDLSHFIEQAKSV